MRFSSVERRIGVRFAEPGYDREGKVVRRALSRRDDGPTPPGHVAALADPSGPEAAEDFERIRCQLFAVAYQIMGRAVDAEDVVQDVWVRWQGVDRARVRDRVAFLVTITKRVALNAATSACSRREVSASGRLPERDMACVDPVLEAERLEALEFAVGLLTKRLSPVEIAVFVLREAFDYPFRQIAEVLGLSEVNARQLACRARNRLAEQRHDAVDPGEGDGLLEAVLDATRAGDVAPLIDALADDAIRRSGRNGGRHPRQHQHHIANRAGQRER